MNCTHMNRKRADDSKETRPLHKIVTQREKMENLVWKNTLWISILAYIELAAYQVVLNVLN